MFLALNWWLLFLTRFVILCFYVFHLYTLQAFSEVELWVFKFALHNNVNIMSLQHDGTHGHYTNLHHSKPCHLCILIFIYLKITIILQVEKTQRKPVNDLIHLVLNKSSHQCEIHIIILNLCIAHRWWSLKNNQNEQYFIWYLRYCRL